MNPSTALATVVVDELRRLGVRDVVLCPGSRSAPFAYALAAAERDGAPAGLRLHVRVDERSAGFLALGLGKVSRRPAAVVTTSGTAVANLHPAVLEAHHGGVPLLVLTADRPAELRGTGANQTTVQPGMFGPALRYAADLPAPERRAGQQAAWRSTLCRAVSAAVGELGTVPGPVHVNVGLREPLVPDAADTAAGSGTGWPESLDGRPGSAPWVERPAVEVAPPTGRVDDQERTLVVVGDLPEPGTAERVLAWAARQGWPVVAEPFGAGGRAGSLPHGPLLLTAGGWVEAHLPARVLTVGRVTLSRPVAALFRRDDVRVEHVTATPGWTDPSHVVERVHPLAVLDAPVPAREPSGWSRAWVDAGNRVAAAVAADPPPWPTGLAVAGTLGRALPRRAILVLGSSNAVRDIDLGVGRLAPGSRVVANRGLAGIDGCVSTAVGVALAAEDEGAATPRCYALVGDLTFLHDANALLVGPHEPRPDLTVVVVNDDGGGIFTLLEPGDPVRADPFERLFGTPTGTDLAALCRAHGVPHTLAGTAADLGAAVASPPRGIRVVEVPVPRASHREAHARLRRLAARVLAAPA